MGDSFEIAVELEICIALLCLQQFILQSKQLAELGGTCSKFLMTSPWQKLEELPLFLSREKSHYNLLR